MLSELLSWFLCFRSICQEQKIERDRKRKGKCYKKDWNPSKGEESDSQQKPTTFHRVYFPEASTMNLSLRVRELSKCIIWNHNWHMPTCDRLTWTESRTRGVGVRLEAPPELVESSSWRNSCIWLRRILDFSFARVRQRSAICKSILILVSLP